MTTRDFDPVFSAALRNELESLPGAAPVRTRTVLRRPQLWITVATALVLLVATLGVLRITGGGVAPVAGRGDAPMEPLLAAGGPRDDDTVRETPVTALLDQRGTGPTSFVYTAPAGTTKLLTYLTCAPRSPVTIVQGEGTLQSRCASDSVVSSMSASFASGRQTLEVQVPEGTRFAVLVLAADPSSTTTASTLTTTEVPSGFADPLNEILDPDSDSYLRAEADVLLQVKGVESGTGTWTMTVPDGVTSIRPYVSCAAEEVYEFGVDGAPRRASTGCDPLVGGSFADIPITPGRHRVSLRLPDATAFALLVVATPVYTPSTAGPAKTPLTYPSLAAGEVIGHERGDAGIVTGQLTGAMNGVSIVITCQGEGAVTVATTFGTLGSPADRTSCGATQAKSSGGAVSGQESVDAPEYTITPYGDVRWTVSFMQLTD